MRSEAFAIEPRLAAASRLSRPADASAAGDAVVLLACGAAAVAAVTLLQPAWRIPGSAMLRAALPILCGLAIAPRRGGGSVAALGGVLGLLAIAATGWAAPRPAAVAAALLLGPSIDAAARLAAGRVSIWVACAVAGGLANAAAFLVRSVGLPGQLSLAAIGEFDAAVFGSFVLCGVLSGLLCGGLVFRVGSDDR